MKYFFAFLLTFNSHLFAANEVWEYQIEGEGWRSVVVATRTVNDMGEDFVVLEPKDGGWNYKDLFEKPDRHLSRYLIGKFTLQSVLDKNIIITDHNMFLRIDWKSDAGGVWVSWDLRSLPTENGHADFIAMRDALKRLSY